MNGLVLQVTLLSLFGGSSVTLSLIKKFILKISRIVL